MSNKVNWDSERERERNKREKLIIVSWISFAIVYLPAFEVEKPKILLFFCLFVCVFISENAIDFVLFKFFFAICF